MKYSRKGEVFFPLLVSCVKKQSRPEPRESCSLVRLGISRLPSSMSSAPTPPTPPAEHLPRRQLLASFSAGNRSAGIFIFNIPDESALLKTSQLLQTCVEISAVRMLRGRPAAA